MIYLPREPWLGRSIEEERDKTERRRDQPRSRGLGRDTRLTVLRLVRFESDRDERIVTIDLRCRSFISHYANHEIYILECHFGTPGRLAMRSHVSQCKNQI